MTLRDVGGVLATVFLSLVFVFVTGEVALRIYTRSVISYDIEMTRYANALKIPSADPRIAHVHRPSSEARLMGVDVRINSAGLRDDETPVERGESRRIVFLGDSLTFGWGVRHEETFASLLEAELSRERPTEILNFGTGNYNTEQQVHLFLEKGLAYRPDAVVVFYFINDAEPTPTPSPWSFLGRSRMITFVWSRAKAALSRQLSSRTFREYYAALYEDGEPGWEAAKAAFRKLAATCDEKGIDLRVVILPELHEPADYPFVEEHAKLARFLDELGVPTLDLAPSFASETEPHRLWVALDDAHPNAVAHGMIAEYSAGFVSGGRP